MCGETIPQKFCFEIRNIFVLFTHFLHLPNMGCATSVPRDDSVYPSMIPSTNPPKACSESPQSMTSNPLYSEQARLDGAREPVVRSESSDRKHNYTLQFDNDVNTSCYVADSCSKVASGKEN